MLGVLKAMIFNPCAEEWKPSNPIECDAGHFPKQDQRSNKSYPSARIKDRFHGKNQTSQTGVVGIVEPMPKKSKQNRKTRTAVSGIVLFISVAFDFIFSTNNHKSHSNCLQQCLSRKNSLL